MTVPVSLAAALAAAAIAVSLAGCAGAPQVRVDRDPSVDLAAYRTFAFADAGGAKGAAVTSIAEGRVEQAARERLEALGYVYRAQDPDLRVDYALQSTRRVDLRGTPAGAGWRHAGWGTGVQTVNYRLDTLRIDLVDARRHAVVWQGTSEARADDAAALQASGAFAEAAVRDIFAVFPVGK